MKRFAKMLALGLTLATVFGMSVSASNSPITVEPTYDYSESQGVTVVAIKSDNLDNGKAAGVNDAAKEAVNAVLYGDTINGVVDVLNISLDEEADTHVVRLSLPALGGNQNYVLLHYSGWEFAGTPEAIVMSPGAKDSDPDKPNNIWYEATLTSGSPFVLVKTTAKAYYDSRVYADYIPEGVTKTDIYPEDAQKGFDAAGTAAAADQVKSVSAGSGYVWAIDKVLDVWNLSTATAGKYEVVINLPVVDSNSYAYALLHYSNWDFTGNPEVILMSCTDVETGKYKATVASGSPFVIVRLQKVAADTDVQSVAVNAAANAAAAAAQPVAQNPAVSPKTGEALPVATIMALVCLAGVAVCVKKARCNG